MLNFETLLDFCLKTEGSVEDNVNRFCKEKNISLESLVGISKDDLMVKMIALYLKDNHYNVEKYSLRVSPSKGTKKRKFKNRNAKATNNLFRSINLLDQATVTGIQSSSDKEKKIKNLIETYMKTKTKTHPLISLFSSKSKAKYIFEYKKDVVLKNKLVQLLNERLKKYSNDKSVALATTGTDTTGTATTGTATIGTATTGTATTGTTPGVELKMSGKISSDQDNSEGIVDSPSATPLPSPIRFPKDKESTLFGSLFRLIPDELKSLVEEFENSYQTEAWFQVFLSKFDKKNDGEALKALLDEFAIDSKYEPVVCQINDLMHKINTYGKKAIDEMTDDYNRELEVKFESLRESFTKHLEASGLSVKDKKDQTPLTAQSMFKKAKTKFSSSVEYTKDKLLRFLEMIKKVLEIIWNAIRHPINTSKHAYKYASDVVDSASQYCGFRVNAAKGC